MHPPSPRENNDFSALKQQLLTFMMFKSTSSSDTNIYSMIYGFIVLALIERIFHILPAIYAGLQNSLQNSVQTIPSFASASEKEKQSSITVQISLAKPDMFGSAILDFITNNPNTKSVYYNNNVFSVNEKTPVLIEPEREIYTLLLKTDISMASATTDNNRESSVENGAKQSIEIYSYLLTTDQLRKYLNELMRKYAIKVQNKLGDKTFYFNAISVPAFVNPDGTKNLSNLPPHFNFTMKEFVTNRRFNNVVGMDAKVIQKRVEFFLQNESWYNEKGIPYTLGFLLSGPPGSGKTSTIKAIANETHRHIINVHINDDVTKSQMENLFFNETINVQAGLGKIEQFTIPINQRIYVFEDVDCQNESFLDRVLVAERQQKEDEKRKQLEPPENNKNQRQQMSNFIPKEFSVKTQPGKDIEPMGTGAERLTLSLLLNLFDGILETPGRIIIMTSNFPERLDRALIRPGRIDLICRFSECSNDMICELFENMYSVVLTKEEQNRIYALPEKQWTPAELSRILFEYFNDYRGALDHIEKRIPVNTNEDDLAI